MIKILLLFTVVLRDTWCRPPSYAPYAAPYPAPTPSRAPSAALYPAPAPSSAPYAAPYPAPAPSSAPYAAPYPAPAPFSAPYAAPYPAPAPVTTRTEWPADVVVWRQEAPWNGSFYSFRFKTLLGISRQEHAYLKENARGQKYLDVEGDYSYPTPDGVFHEVRYRADDRGYRVTAAAEVEATPNPGRLTYDKQHLNANSYKNNPDFRESLKNPNIDTERIVFPNEFEEDRVNFKNMFGGNEITTTTPSSMDATNTTEFEDELVNRMGNIPPAVLASLLGR